MTANVLHRERSPLRTSGALGAFARSGPATFLLLTLCSLSLSACAARTGSAGQAASAIATPSLFSRDRIVIRQHTDIVAVSATQRSVFAVSTHGLIVYDRIFERWRTPDARITEDLTAAGVVNARIRAMAADPIEDAVWIAVPGAVVIYRVAAQQVQRLAVAGQPDDIRFARGDASDAYVRTGNQWLRVSRAGFVTPATADIRSVSFLPAVQLGDVYQRYPALRGQLPLLLRDRDERQSFATFSQVSDATFSAEQPAELFVGTIGDGLWSFNADFFSASPLRYGLLDDAVGALAIGAEGVWAAGQGQSMRGGLTFVGRDAQQFAWLTSDMGSTARGLTVRDLVVRGSEAWLATDRGVRIVSVTGNANTRDLTTLNGLPDNDVSSVLPMSGATWIGTRAGLAVITDTSENRDASSTTSPDIGVQGDVVEIADLRGVPVHALARRERLLLVGTARGVYTLDAASARATDAATLLWPVNQAARAPVRALASSDSLALIVTDVDAWILALPEGITGAASRVPSPVGALPPVRDSGGSRSDNPAVSRSAVRTDIRAVGRVVAAALDGESVWVAGERGVMAWGRDGSAPKLLRTGRELPDLVSDVVLDGPMVWIGTRQGLVRVQRARDGGLP